MEKDREVKPEKYILLKYIGNHTYKFTRPSKLEGLTFRLWQRSPLLSNAEIFNTSTRESKRSECSPDIIDRFLRH